MASSYWLKFGNSTLSYNGSGLQSPGLSTVFLGGRTYHTRTLRGKTWLVENLDYAFPSLDVGPSGYPTSPAAWYYNNDEATYGSAGRRCGLLYNWYAVKYLEDNKETLIPGWHVPDYSEWYALLGGGETPTADGIFSMHAATSSEVPWTSMWHGGNAWDTTIIPTGQRIPSYGFSQDTHSTYFWTYIKASGEVRAIQLYEGDVLHHLFSVYTAGGPSGTRPLESGFSVRLVMDT